MSVLRARVANETYLKDLRVSMASLLPDQGLALIEQGRRWSDRMLTICGLLWTLVSGRTLGERFCAARDAVVRMYASRQRPGDTYEGFIKALAARTDALADRLIEHFRIRMQQLAGGCWKTGKFIVFAADSSKLDLPMTKANEEAFEVASRDKSWPQMLLGTLIHLGTGLPWSWRLGKATDSERTLLRRMIDDLPPHVLLVADAGFVGFDLIKTILSFGHQTLIRGGANIKLIEKLGCDIREYEGGIIYLWPDKKRRAGMTPLILRKVVVIDGRNRRMVLLTSVLDTHELSDSEIARLYGLRWGIELFYRTLKQTLGHSKLRSCSPENAMVEGQWMMLGIWMLGLMMLKQREPEVMPDRQSAALALQAVRETASGRLCTLTGPRHPRLGRARYKRRPRHRARLGEALRAALKDSYQRSGSKKARHWPDKKKAKPPGEPKARMAKTFEVRRANELISSRATK